MKLSWLSKKFPYKGIKNWALLCSLAFIVFQFLWQLTFYFSSFIRNYDFLEIPMVILFFPLAPLFDPHDAMLRDDNIYFYAIIYWLLVFLLSRILSRRKINPAIPGIVIVLLSCMASLSYSLYILWRGPFAV